MEILFFALFILKLGTLKTKLSVIVRICLALINELFFLCPHVNEIK